MSNRGRYKTFDGPHNQTTLDQLVGELMERVHTLETPRKIGTTSSGLVVSGASGFHAYDQAGNEVLGTDDAAGTGLRGPRVSYESMTIAEYNSPSQTTTSGTFVPLFVVHGKQEHSSIECVLLTNVPAANVGEARVMDYTNPSVPVQVGSTATLNPSSAGTYVEIAGPLSGYSHRAFKVFRVEARRTSGAGSIGLSVAWFAGKGT